MSALLLSGLIGAALAADTVTLSGVVQHSAAGALRVEVLLVVPDGQAPLLVAASTIEGPGPFSIRIPARVGQVRLRVAADDEGDGVGPDDAQGVLPEPLMVGSQDITGVSLSLRRPDLNPNPGDGR
ncbi:MAG: hypothetical protein H6739_02845 [Alphaproteobacteria bacterium]|nr:hypothetical protein [Alphaproteobacteria bacterium]